MSTIEVNKITPVSGGTTVQVGESGDTINIPSGATLANAGSVTGLPASAISSGTIATARLGSGTASSSTVLFGDQTYKTAPSGTHVLLNSSNASGLSDITFDNFSTTYNKYRILGSHSMGVNNAETRMRIRKSGSDETGSNYRNASLTVYRNGSSGSAVGSDTSWNATSVSLTGGSSYSAGHRTVVDITVFSPANATYQTFMQTDIAYYYPGGDAIFRWSGMVWIDGDAGKSNTGIKFYSSSGTLDNARWEIYGIKDS